MRGWERGVFIYHFESCFLLALLVPFASPRPDPSLGEPKPCKFQFVVSEEVIKSISKGSRKIQVRGIISRSSEGREGFVCIKDRDNFIISRNSP
jgi:hypothetical protein